MATPKELLHQSVELVKDTYKASKAKDENGDITDALMTLREHLQGVREGFSKLEEDNQALQARVAELEKSLEVQPELERSNGLYWKKGDPDPWCPRCWESERRALHLNPTAVLAGRLRVCPGCDFDVNMDNVEPPEPVKWTPK